VCYTTGVQFELVFTFQAHEELGRIQGHDPKQYKKIAHCLATLEQDPRYPGLQSHPYETFDEVYGQKVWESYVENNTPSAWRIWWAYGPNRGQITVLTIGPHP